MSKYVPNPNRLQKATEAIDTALASVQPASESDVATVEHGDVLADVSAALVDFTRAPRVRDDAAAAAARDELRPFVEKADAAAEKLSRLRATYADRLRTIRGLIEDPRVSQLRLKLDQVIPRLERALGDLEHAFGRGIAHAAGIRGRVAALHGDAKYLRDAVANLKFESGAAVGVAEMARERIGVVQHLAGELLTYLRNNAGAPESTPIALDRRGGIRATSSVGPEQHANFAESAFDPREV